MTRQLGACLILVMACGGGDDDVPMDAGVDARDGNLPDTPLPPDDAEPDSAPPGPACGDLGDPCMPDRGCSRSAFCQAEAAANFDPADEDVVDLPAGTDTTGVLFAGGYGTTDDFSAASRNICDPTDTNDTTCGECGSCIALPSDTMCVRNCEPTGTDNSDCRDGYACMIPQGVCFPGCNSDTECRIGRVESNGIAGLQTPDDCTETPADCGGDATNFDNLVYRTEGNPTCNMETFRCEFEGPAEATAGDTCDTDFDCESNGQCIDFTDDDGEPAWPGNYCTKFRCDLDGLECANGGKCQERGLGDFLCVAGCSVGTGADVDAEDPSTWLVAEGGCREGYTCNWDGASGAGVADNGGCVPGEFNEVTESNTGGPCTEDADCWSPFGRGFCIDENDGNFLGGYCSQRDCGAPGLPAGICGDGGECIPGFDPDDTTFALCLDACETPEDCRDGYGCIALTAGGNTHCFPACQEDDECKASQRCEIPVGAMAGDCVDR
ncbi:MAG: hypothetical protein AAGE52_28750 [Myxococcota bacterium]